MFRKLLLCCVFCVALSIAACSGGDPPLAPETNAIEPAVPGFSFELPDDRQAREWIPQDFVKGSEYLVKNPRSIAHEFSGGLSLVSEDNGLCYAIYELRPGDDLVDHLIVRDASTHPGCPQPYLMVANYALSTWETVETERDPIEKYLLYADVADWSACESPGGSIYFAVLNQVDPGTVATGEWVNSVYYVSIVTVEDQALSYLERIIEDEVVYRRLARDEGDYRSYVDLSILYSGLVVPELHDESMIYGHLPHGIELLVINPTDLSYAAIAAYQRRDSSWGVWVRDTDGQIRIDSYETDHREAIAVEALKQLRRAEESYFHFHGTYGDLMNLRIPPTPNGSFIGATLAMGSIGHQVAVSIQIVSPSGYIATASVIEGLYYEMHEDGVIVKVE